MNHEASGHDDENDVIRNDIEQKDCPRDLIPHGYMLQGENGTTTVEAVGPGREDHGTDWGSSPTSSGGNAAACPNTATNSSASTPSGPLLSTSEVFVFKHLIL